MASTNTVTEYDAQGNPVTLSPTVAEYDAQGNPVPSQKPTIDLSNPQRQGTYQMTDANGQTVGVPYGKVTDAAQHYGYQFADDQNRWRYAKDNAVDPNRSTTFTPTLAEQTPEGRAAAQEQREQQAPIGAGIGKGAGDTLQMLNPVNAVKGAVESFPPVALEQSIQQSIPAFKAFEKAYKDSGGNITEGLAAANEVARNQNTARQAIEQRLAEFKKNPTEESARLLTDAAGLVATAYVTHSAGAAPEAEGAVAEGESTPGLLKQIVKGKEVNQPMAQGAVRSGVQAGVEDAGTDVDVEGKPILDSNSTIVDDHLNQLKTLEKAAYKKVDDAVGFDLKAEKAQLANDNYKLAQLGNTDSDITQRGNLIEAINDSQGRIDAAQATLKTAGIDPTDADALHQQRMAGLDFKKLLVRATAPDGTVNVDKLLNGSKTLRFTKYGDRLTQFFGSKDAADAYMQQLQEAQRIGAHALKAQTIAKWVGLGTAGLLGVDKGAKVISKLLSP